MALAFAGRPIPGTNGPPMLAPPQAVNVRNHFSGVKGESEIRLEYAGRPIRYDVLLFHSSFTSVGKVVELMKLFDLLVSTHGVLEETGNVPRTFNDVTYEGMTPLGGIKRDVGGCLVAGSNVYFVPVSLQFYQLSIELDS